MEKSFFIIFTAVTMLETTSAYYHNENRCSIYNNGCAFHVVLVGSNCSPQNDAPYASPYRSERETPSVAAQKAETTKMEEVTVKKLDELETKLVKMMEGLSVRSLRHIRQIKDDLKQMTNTMKLLKPRGRKGKGNKHGIECPEEFVGVGTWPSCYRFSNFNASWNDAREYCSAFGANLVALDTLKESYILDYLIKSQAQHLGPKGWWTAGNYIVRNHKWMWTSKHHLKPINFSRWAPGEPDARSVMHCLLLYKDAKYLWHDAMCSDKHNFICEIELSKDFF